MLPDELRDKLQHDISQVEFPREKVVDVLYALQNHYGYLCDEAMVDASWLLGMTLLELEQLATFYDFLYRRPVGRHILHVCDGVVCWMYHQYSILDHLCRKLGVGPGQTTEDGLFTVLPAGCVGNCHQAPAMLVNGRFYGELTPEKIDSILDELRASQDEPVQCR